MERQNFEKKLKELLHNSVLPTIQSSTHTLANTADGISLSTLERLEFVALKSDGWTNDLKNLAKIASAITNQKSLLDQKYEMILKLIGDLKAYSA